MSLADIFCEEDNLEENGEEDCMENVVECMQLLNFYTLATNFH